MVTTGCAYKCNDAACTYTCNSIPPGQYLLHVGPDVIQFAQQAMLRKKEYGGKLAIDIQSGTLRLGGGSWGKRDSVNIPHAIFE